MARDLNSILIVGRLTADCEFKITPSGKELAKFRIANNRSFGQSDQQREETGFFDVLLWGKLAGAIKTYLVKGKQIGIQGRLQQSRWEQDGQPRSRVEIVAENVQMFSSGASGSGGGNYSSQKQSSPRSPEPSYPEPEPMGPSNEEIPF